VQAETNPVIFGGNRGERMGIGALAASASGDKRKHPPTIAVSGCQGVGATGLEPVTPSVSKGFSRPPKSSETLDTPIFYANRISFARGCKRFLPLAKKCGNSAVFTSATADARKVR